MDDPHYSAIISEFELRVREEFAYLEVEFGFNARPPRARDLDEPRDAVVSIRYETDAVSIEIGMSLTGDGIAVNFKNKNWRDAPRGQRVKWVSLDSVIAFRTDGAAKTLLHELTSSRHKYWPHGFLLKQMEWAIRTLATRTKQHAIEILRGDLTSLANIAGNNE